MTNTITFPPVSGEKVNIAQVTGSAIDEVMSQKAVTDALGNKVDKEAGKSLVSNTEIEKLSTAELYAQKNTVNSVAGKQGDVLLDKSDVGLSNVNNTADKDKPLSDAQAIAMMAKFDLRNVTQEVGYNGSKVISQKASTEAFYRAGPGVVKAGKIYVQSTEPTENVEEGDIWLKI